MEMKSWARMQFLKLKAKIRTFLNIEFVIDFIDGFDLTPIFVFASLHLFGYSWNWKTAVASLGIWIVFKDIMKHSRFVLSGIDIKIINR